MDVKFRIPLPVLLAILFLLGVGFLVAFGYGVAVEKYKLFPYRYVDEVTTALQWFRDRSPVGLPWYYRESERLEARAMAIDHPEPEALNLVASLAANDRISLKVIDMQGATVREWATDVFEIFPNPDYLPENLRPKNLPGSHIHGMAVLPDGDVVFNFNDVGAVRMNACGEVVWTLRELTHHSVYLDEYNDLWISGRDVYEQNSAEWPLHKSPRWDPLVLQVSAGGEIKRRISLMEVMRKNGLEALLLMRGDTLTNNVAGDNLHLNDVVTFPSSLEEGVFRHGDIMVSLRNINTVLVFDPDTFELRYLKTGGFVRQHDPDFVDGNTITLFDNNFVARNPDPSSRILRIDARTDEIEVVYTGSADDPFFTRIMGRHQHLPGGRILISEPTPGRAFEIDVAGNIIWEHINRVSDGLVGVMEEVQRLPTALTGVYRDTDCGDQG